MVGASRRLLSRVSVSWAWAMRAVTRPHIVDIQVIDIVVDIIHPRKIKSPDFIDPHDGGEDGGAMKEDMEGGDLYHLNSSRHLLQSQPLPYSPIDYIRLDNHQILSIFLKIFGSTRPTLVLYPLYLDRGRGGFLDQNHPAKRARLCFYTSDNYTSLQQ